MFDTIELNGRRYNRPARPTVVICADGVDPRYLDQGVPDGVFPTIGAFARDGFFAVAEGAMPSFTNPNNVSIVTGAPPAVHGIAGNYFLDRASGREIMMTDPALMRSETILAHLAAAGVRVAAITAKDKLRRLLAHGLDGIAFSSECAPAEIEEMVERKRPDMYSADLSLFVLDAGLRLLECGAAELFYLSLSDYVQHLHAPGTPEADAFHHALDRRVRRFVELGAVVGLVADHGMNDKPRAVFVEDELAARFGTGTARVICPITDPFVRHHGALGSFVRVYVRAADEIPQMMAACADLPGVARVLDGAEAACEFELPADREADFVVLGDAETALGAARAGHDLSALAGHPLRSHGGEAERNVPFILSHALSAAYRERAATRPLRNYDIFDFVLNGVA